MRTFFIRCYRCNANIGCLTANSVMHCSECTWYHYCEVRKGQHDITQLCGVCKAVEERYTKPQEVK